MNNLGNKCDLQVNCETLVLCVREGKASEKNWDKSERAWLVMSERNNLSNSVDTVLTLPGNKEVDSVLPAASLPVSKEQPSIQWNQRDEIKKTVEKTGYCKTKQN